MTRNKPYTRLQYLFKDIHDQLKGSFQAEMRQWKSEKNSKKACAALRSEQEVKTIWKTNEAIRIDRFYYPSKVARSLETNEKEVPFLVRSISDFGTEKGVLIEGIVGHGKSILLRHLHNNELNEGDTIPLFIELRNVPSPKDLVGSLLEYVKSKLGLRCSVGLLKELLSRGFVSLFLDGLDEIKIDERKGFLYSIEEIKKNNPLAKVVVTSRPEGDLIKSTSFSVFRLSILNDEDQEGFIKRLISVKEEYEPLIKNLSNTKDDIRGLINTPLILTLFTFVYKSKIKIPDSYSDFYKQLFDTLLSSHDGLKLGFDRPTKSKLTASQIKTVLEFLTLRAKRGDYFSFDRDVFGDLCRRSLSDAKLDISMYEKVMDDLVKVTCLIQKDGDDYKFLHNTIVYYFSASCIKNNASDEHAAKFYKSRLESGDWKQWINELDFLSNIDELRFNCNFVKPAIMRLFNSKCFPKEMKVTSDAADRILKSYIIIVGEDKDKDKEKESGFYVPYIFMNEPSCWAVDKLFCDSVHEGVDKIDPTKFLKDYFNSMSPVMKKTLLKIAKKEGVLVQFSSGKHYILRLNMAIKIIGATGYAIEYLNMLDFSSAQNLYKKTEFKASTSYDTEALFS